MKQSPMPRRREPMRRTSLKGLQAKCCGKKTWATREAADAALLRILRTTQDETGKVPQRVYECPRGFFHLTSKDEWKPASSVPQKSAKKRADDREWEQVRRVVFVRDDGLCAYCGTSIPWGDGYECHHRWLRSQGGKHDLANLIALHKFPCHRFVHDNRDWSRRNGFIVHKPAKPEAMPVHRFKRSWEQPGEQWTPSAAPQEVAA